MLLDQKVILVIAVVALSLLVINLRHHSRLLVTEFQQLKLERDSMNIEWGKLLLEEGAWSQHQRIEVTAKTKLGMALPSRDQLVIVSDVFNDVRMNNTRMSERGKRR